MHKRDYTHILWEDPISLSCGYLCLWEVRMIRERWLDSSDQNRPIRSLQVWRRNTANILSGSQSINCLTALAGFIQKICSAGFRPFPTQNIIKILGTPLPLIHSLLECHWMEPARNHVLRCGQELLNIIYIAMVMPISYGNFDSLNTCNLKYEVLTHEPYGWFLRNCQSLVLRHRVQCWLEKSWRCQPLCHRQPLCHHHSPLMGPRTCMKTSYVLEDQFFLGYQSKWIELNYWNTTNWHFHVFTLHEWLFILNGIQPEKLLASTLNHTQMCTMTSLLLLLHLYTLLLHCTDTSTYSRSMNLIRTTAEVSDW